MVGNSPTRAGTDVIKLTAGDLVPADGLLFQARDLHVQQAALTGESLPVEKEASDVRAISQDASDDHKVFLGTSVVSGTDLDASN